MSRKYAKDYRVETRLNSAGRQELYAVYEGAYYWFSCPQAELKRLKLWYGVLSVLADVFLAILLFSSNRFHPNFRYLILPAALSVVPTYYVLSSAARLCLAREPVVRKHRDKICKTLPGAALVQSLLALLSVAAQLLQPLLHGWDASAIWLLVCAVCYAAASWLLVLRRGALKMEELPAE